MITGDTPRSPLPLLRVAQRATQRLRDPDVTPPEPLSPGGPPAREEWAALLEPAAKELRQALEELQHGRSKGRETLVDKQRALDEHDRDVGRSSRLAEALFGLANRPYIAGRVRSLSPRQRRRRRQLLRERPTAKNQTAKATERVTDRPDARSEAET